MSRRASLRPNGAGAVYNTDSLPAEVAIRLPWTRWRQLSACCLLACALSGQAPDAALKELIEAARQAEQRGDLTTAVEAYRKILRLRPGWAAAEFNLALIHHSRGNCPDAIPLLEGVLRREPSLADAHLFLGSCYLQTGQPRRARSALERFLQRKPASEEGAALLAEAQFRMGDYAPAARGFLRRIQREPQRGELYYFLREAYLHMAGACLRELSERSDGAYLRELAALEEGSGVETETVGLPERAGEFPEAYLVAGARRLRQGRRAEAAKAFEAAIQLDPEAGPFLVALAGGEVHPRASCSKTAAPLARAACEVARGRLAAAGDAVLALYEKKGRSPRKTYWSMRLFARLAELVVAKLEARAPDSPVLTLIRAKVFEQAGALGEADREYARGLVGRQEVDLLVEYGKFKCRTGEFEAALALFEQALAQDPRRWELHGLIGEVRMIRGEPERALPHLESAVRGGAGGAQTVLYWAQALHRLGRTPEAIRVLQAAPADPDGRLHYLLARYLSQQGRKQEAARALAVFREKRRSGQPPTPLGSLNGAAAPEP
jgi:tetratricopeptide (TPR) repeat protein